MCGLHERLGQDAGLGRLDFPVPLPFLVCDGFSRRNGTIAFFLDSDSLIMVGEG